MAATPTKNDKMLNVRIKQELRDKLNALAEATGRTQTYIVEEALESFYDLHAWQIAAIEEGIRAVDEGDVTSHEDVKSYWESKLVHDGHQMVSSVDS